VTPTIGLITPVKAAVGAWLASFHAQAYPDTPANAEWVARDPKQACAFARGRMVDSVGDMIASYQKNANNTPKVSTAAVLPILLAAIADEYTETPTDQGRMGGATQEVIFPFDTAKRIFHVRTVPADFRMQVAIAASEQPSVLSLIGQLAAWSVTNYRATAIYPFDYLGVTFPWPVRIVPGERMSIATPLGEQIVVMTMDFTVRVAMPMIYTPKAGDAIDIATPPGFASIHNVEVKHKLIEALGPPTNVDAALWRMYLSRIHEWPHVVLHPLSDQTRPPWNQYRFK